MPLKLSQLPMRPQQPLRPSQMPAALSPSTVTMEPVPNDYQTIMIFNIPEINGVEETADQVMIFPLSQSVFEALSAPA